MKKLFALMLCIVLTLSMVACGEEAKTPETTEPTTAPTTEAPTTEEPTTEMPTETLEEPTEEEPVEEMGFMFEFVSIDAEGMMNPTEPTEDMLFVQSLFEGMEPLANVEMPGYYIVAELTADLFESDVFTPYVDGMTAVRCEAGMGSQPYSIVVLNVPEGTDVEAVRADIEANANPRKWVCVEAEQVNVVANGNTILLAMASSTVCDTLVANFNAKMAG